MEQMILNAVILEANYALIALGITLIFSIMNVLNFAHGQMYMLGGFVVYYLQGIYHLNDFLSLITVVLVLGSIGILFEEAFFRRVLKTATREETSCFLLWALLYTYGVATGKLSLPKMVDIFATTPAKIYGLYPQKGSLAIGADADIVIFDPSWKGTIRVKTSHPGLDYNVFEGLHQTGRVERVFLRGTLCVDGGDYVVNLGQCKFIRRIPYGFAYTGWDSK